MNQTCSPIRNMEKMKFARGLIHLFSFSTNEVCRECEMVSTEPDRSPPSRKQCKQCQKITAIYQRLIVLALFDILSNNYFRRWRC